MAESVERAYFIKIRNFYPASVPDRDLRISDLPYDITLDGEVWTGNTVVRDSVSEIHHSQDVFRPSIQWRTIIKSITDVEAVDKVIGKKRVEIFLRELK